jgi:hypothetical protein
MTRTRTRTYGVAIPSSRQPLLEAMLRAFGWLVSNIVSMLATIFNRPTRDWHTGGAREDQLPTPGDPTPKGARHSQLSFSGKRAARIPRIPVASTQGTTPNSHAPRNQDARDKPEHDSLDDLEAELQLRVPRVCVGEERRRRRDLVRGTKSRDASRELCSWPPVLRAAQTHMHRSARTRADQAPAFAGDTVVRSRLKSA